MIGKTLDGRYRIIQELGRGGFGETFVAIDIKLHNSRCVVKKLNPFSEYRGTLKARILFELVKKLNPFSEYRKTLKLARRLFEQESKIMLRLEHNQIPRLLAYFEQNKNFFLAQELVQGHPLNEEIRVGEQWTVDTMVHFLASALKPLAYIHTQHVIHRDIKPANLMRRDIDGEIVLIDFGAVKEVIKSSRHDRVQAVNTIAIGTTGYTPYEQSERQPKFSSDIYALGITCIEALTGRAATELEKDPHSEISWRHLVNIDIDPRLADILDRMVRYDFRQRYSSGGEALAAVQAYIEPLPSPLSPPTLSYVPQHKLVNTYSDDFEPKPTKKLSIAIKVSHVLNFSKTTVISRIYLFLQRHLNVIQRIDNLGIRLQIWRDIFCIYSLYIGLPLVTVVTLSAFHSFWQLFSGVSLFISLPIGLTFVIFIREITIIRLIGYVSLVMKILDHRLNNNLRYLFIKPFLEGNLTVPLTSLFCAGSSLVSLAISFISAGIFAWTDGLFLTVLYITLNIIEGGFPKPSNNYKNFLWRIGNGSSFFLANLTAWSIESNLFSLKIIDSPKGNPFTSMSISQWLLLTVAQFISYIIIKSLIASLLIDLPIKSHRTIDRSKE